MAIVHFFANTNDIEAQSGQAGDEAFGPVGGNSNSQFRVTSLHKGVLNSGNRANPMAYSVCGGRIRVQQDATDPDLLTLILAPDQDLIPGLPIRYFIYRGIKKDTLVTSPTVLAPSGLSGILALDSDLNNDVPDAIGLAFRPAAASPPNPIFTREDTDTLESIFFETTTLKAININAAGIELGNFHGAHFGFEIILDSIWEEPTLNIVRNIRVSGAAPLGNIIDVPNTATAIQARAIREKVYSYLDPAAFYGMCNPKELKYKVLTTDPVQTVNTTQLLFDTLLIKFHNRNKIYLDIRNENALSYNYYDTYDTGEILISTDSTVLDKKAEANLPLAATNNQPYHTNDWPIKILDGASFTTTAGEKKAGIRLALRSGTTRTSRQLFIRVGNLYYNTNKKKGGDDFHKPKNNDAVLNILSQNDWTAETVFAAPIILDSTVQKAVASYFRVHYIRQNEAGPVVADRYVATPAVWDNLFVIKPNQVKWQNNQLTSWWLSGHLKSVRPMLGNQQVYDGIAESGIAIDRDSINMTEARITFYYVPVIALKRPASYRVVSGTKVSGTAGLPGQAASFFQVKETGSSLDDGALTLHLQKVSEHIGAVAPPNPATKKTFLTYTETVPAYLTTGNAIDPDAQAASPHNSRESVYAISMTAAEYQLVVNAIGTAAFDTSLHPVFLQATIGTGREAATATDRAYQTMELSLVGYTAAGVYLRHVIPVASVQPLSLMSDGHLFCTDLAAKFEPAAISWNHGEICELDRHTTMAAPADDADHASDTLLYRSALAEIKRYHPIFYGRMERLRQLGAEVILHDNPGVKTRQFYRILIGFHKTMASPSGETDVDNTNGYYNGAFPSGDPQNPNPNLRSSMGLRIFDLETAGAVNNAAVASTINSLFNNNAIGHLNATRYALLNRDKNKNSSQVNELFLKDYTSAEIANVNFFDDTKLYLESYYNANGIGVTNQYHRITLAEAMNLGLGTLNSAEPIRIIISRVQMLQRVTSYQSNVDVNVPAYNPRQEFVSSTLIHELGHAEDMIRNPTANLIWSDLESYFQGTTTNLTITEQNPPNTPGFSNTRLVAFANYPSPLTIIRSSMVPNPGNTLTPVQKTALAAQYDAVLLGANFQFLAKTGGGHLRGSPNAQDACMVGRIFNEEYNKLAVQIVKDAVKASGTLLGYSIPGGQSYDYCFLNFQDARLQ
jgi:hypothetical protein